MTQTLIFAGGALLMVAAVLFLLLRPLRRRPAGAEFSRRQLNAAIYRDELAELDRDLATGDLSQADYDQACAELQRRLLEDSATGGESATAPHSQRSAAIALLVLIPVGAILLYLALGNPAALNPPAPEKRFTQQDIERMVTNLAAKLENEPDNLQGWAMLARSYKAMGRNADAVHAFERAGKLVEGDPDLLLSYADALATRDGGFDAKSNALVDKALKLAPNHPMGLWMRGTVAFNAKRYDQALADWEKLLAQLEPGSDDARTVQGNIDEVRALMGKPAAKPATPATKVGAGGTVRGHVELAPALKAQVAPQDVLMVIARPADGSRMPVAVLRTRAADLPLAFTLDDSLSMSPDRRVSQFPELAVEARISKSGEAMPRPGDLISAVRTVKTGATDVLLKVDQVRK